VGAEGQEIGLATDPHRRSQTGRSWMGWIGSIAFNVSMSLESLFFTPGLRETASRSFTSALAYETFNDQSLSKEKMDRLKTEG